MATQARTDVFNDGLLAYGSIQTKRIKGKAVGKVFSEAGGLYFAFMEARSSDYALAEGDNVSIDLKVKTPYEPGFSKRKPSQVVLEGEQYDVVSLDWDAGRTKLFWYLQKGGE
ncbi:TPA_asm: head-tail adaptor protein [Listeria monocytogenes]|nr:head-tail adaptor protein [Listeria monocytogenes]